MADANYMLYLGAIALGALHAFEPGHGKTIIAAYMIGTRGRAVDGVLLGLIVTFTHTFSVIILGIVAKVLSRSYTEAELHSWLGLFSALLILAVGLWMLKERLTGDGGHRHFHLFGSSHDHGHDQGHDLAHDHGLDHSHPHPHDHPHSHGNDRRHAHPHEHSHPHRHDDTHHHGHSDDDHAAGHLHGAGTKRAQAGRYSKWNLLLLGISGGLVPCPAAIATLLAAIGAGRIAQGLTMAIFFSLGLGAVMMSIGVALSHAGRLTAKIGDNLELGRRMGIASAGIITLLGCYTLFHSLRSLL